MESVLDSLSDSQRQCLRLVAQNKSSKEIAIELGLSPNTVDQYLARAAATLGCSNRREAARIFAEQESEYRKSEYKTAELVTDGLSEDHMAVRLDDGEGGFWSRLRNLVPAIGGKRHDLTQSEIIFAILRLSLITTGAVAAMVAVYFWLNRLLV